jgi:hypothetical protein
VKEVMNRPPFEVLSLASSISASLQIWWRQCNIVISSYPLPIKWTQ